MVECAGGKMQSNQELAALKPSVPLSILENFLKVVNDHICSLSCPLRRHRSASTSCFVSTSHDGHPKCFQLRTHLTVKCCNLLFRIGPFVRDVYIFI